jgi:hypothetical protein
MADQVKIDILTDDEEYLAFLTELGQSNPAVLGYHFPFYREMLSLIGVGQPLYLGAWRGGRLVGVLPGLVRRTNLGSVYSSLPYFGPNAGVLSSNEEQERTTHSALIAAVLDFMSGEPRSISASFYTPFLFNRFELYAQALPQAVVIPKTTQYLFLPEASWDSKIRYDLRRAERLGLTLSTELNQERIQSLYCIYEQNCSSKGIPLKPRAALDYLLTRGIERGHVSCYLALRDGIVVGALIVIWSPLTASYYLPCALLSEQSAQPGTLLIDLAVTEARRRGVRFWNWEASSSPDSGVHKFKRKWGSAESDYRIYVLPYLGLEEFREIGRERLAVEFPYFFVYPYSQL